jgi:hypothetical protein
VENNNNNTKGSTDYKALVLRSWDLCHRPASSLDSYTRSRLREQMRDIMKGVKFTERNVVVFERLMTFLSLVFQVPFLSYSSYISSYFLTMET